MYFGIDPGKYRETEHEIDPLFTNRWSPRALAPEAIRDEELMSLFEAARWAASSFNGQPWRFVFARRTDPEWEGFLGLLGEKNQSWAKNAAALVVVLSRKTFEHNEKPAATHSFDTGLASANLALQAVKLGLVAHFMQGFNYTQARALLSVPEKYAVEAMVAIGRPGNIEDLPESLRKGERPNSRNPLFRFVMQGRFKER